MNQHPLDQFKYTAQKDIKLMMKRIKILIYIVCIKQGLNSICFAEKKRLVALSSKTRDSMTPHEDASFEINFGTWTTQPLTPYDGQKFYGCIIHTYIYIYTSSHGKISPWMGKLQCDSTCFTYIIHT